MVDSANGNNESDVLYSVADGVGTLTLNRPHQRNAFTPEMVTRWRAVLDLVHRDESLSALVITGAGGNFCAGADVVEMSSRDLSPADERHRLANGIQGVIRSVATCPVPTVAAIEGAAVGAGLDVALACDLRVAARSARLSAAYLRVGLLPGAGGCHLLPRVVGISRALELLLTCEFASGEDALAIGLVNRVYDDDSFSTDVASLLSTITRWPPVATRLLKRSLYQSAQNTLDASLDLAASHLAVLRTMEDTTAALHALRNGSTARFTGR